MKKTLLSKILAIGIIILFIGVGIHPAFATDTKQTIVNMASEEDCGCNDIDDRQLFVLDKQLNRLAVYGKLLLALSKDYPELEKKCEKLTNMITNLKTAGNEYICLFLLMIFGWILAIGLPIQAFMFTLPENGILYKIVYAICEILGIQLAIIWQLMELFC